MLGAEFIIFTDEDGEPLTFVENGEEYIVCQVWYSLGDVVASENVPAEFIYDDATKAERLRIYEEEEAEIAKNMV